MPKYEKDFDRNFRQWVNRTCKEWGYGNPPENYYDKIYARLPSGLRTILGYGIAQGIILDAGRSKSGSAGFRPKGLPEMKGPYSWFERDNQKKIPRPAWEYYIQISEYVRLIETFKGKNYELKFEDDLMDIAVYRNRNILICCEIKEKSRQASRLIGGIKVYETAKSLPSEDRGKDPLRKAKYIVKHRPAYFYTVSIGRRYEYRLEYPEGKQFEMVEDLIPFI